MDDIVKMEVRWAQGFPNQRVEFIDAKTACYTCGNYIIFLDIKEKTRRVFQCPGRGIGIFTASGSCEILAFSEQRLNPSIFLYGYPELKLKSELKGKAEFDYSCLALSDCGPYLCSCSSVPDHTITVWNWEKAEAICSQPQAGKDVISLAFNPMCWLQICALGTSSLVVWNIEKTETHHILKESRVDLPAADGSGVEKEETLSHIDLGRTYWGPQMPTSAISGLTGDKADSFVPQQRDVARLTPVAVCWTATSKLYVGCQENMLLLVDAESLSVSVLFNPKDASGIPEFRKGSFQSLALIRDGVIAAGTEIHCLQIKETHIKITQTLRLEEPAKSVMCSPDYKTLLFASSLGNIYRYNLLESGAIVKVLDVLSGNFVAGEPLYTNPDIHVSVRDTGEMQLWSMDSFCTGSLALQTEVTSLACCPAAQYAAVGTASGDVWFVDLLILKHPRVVHKVHLCHGPVGHLDFDQGGNFLFTGASDCHVFVLNAKPSKKFQLIGYTVVPGPIVSLSTHFNRNTKQVDVLVLCTGQKDKEQEGSVLKVFSLAEGRLSAPGCVDLYGCLLNDSLKAGTYKVPDALQSCVLGISEVFAYCQRKKALQSFQLPQGTDRASGQRETPLSPAVSLEGHPLGPACIALSPHKLWLASAGRDGKLRVRETASMTQFAEIQGHSCRLGGIRSVSFAADGQTLVTAGWGDGLLLCTQLSMEPAGVGKGAEATKYMESMAQFLGDVVEAENAALAELVDWAQASPSLPGSDSTQEEAKATTEAADDTEPVGSSAAPAPNPTWLESRREAVIKAENERFSDAKKNLRRKIGELRRDLLEMMREDENLSEFVDEEAQERLAEKRVQEVTKMRNEIELDNLAKCYLHAVLKRECWDLFKVKAKAVKGFHSELEVKNYPMKERTETELEDLDRVENIREIERTNNTVQKKVLEVSSAVAPKKEEEETDSSATSGSLAPQLGCSHPHLYDQFHMHTIEQKMNQITLLQDVIYKVKLAFNIEFEAMFKKKQQEVNNIRGKNSRIMAIAAELRIVREVWNPSLSDSEQPERALTVEDSEIDVERYLTPEQQKEKAVRRKLEEDRLLPAKGDNIRERALDDMMGGTLEVKKEDILNVEIPQPEFVAAKPDTQFNEEEKKLFGEYMKKCDTLRVAQEAHRKALEIEMKKLHTAIKESTQGFDLMLPKLFERKVKSEMVIYQEELKIANLVYSILIEKEINNREAELSHKLETKRAYESEVRDDVEHHEEAVRLFHETYDDLVAEDKLLDKGFRKEFFDVSSHYVDLLYKLYKRRPRVEKMVTHGDNALSPFKERPQCSWMMKNVICQTSKAMDELDSLEHQPEGLEPIIWERFCRVRRAKIEIEQEVKKKAMTLAEMQAFLQKRSDEEETLKQEIQSLKDELVGLRDEKILFQQDIMVQVLVKQGQVEVAPTDFIADHSHSVLLDRSVVESLNATIKMLGEKKIATMVERKDFRKRIIKQIWEHKRMRMQMENLNHKVKDIQSLFVSDELQEYLNTTGVGNRKAKQVAAVEKKMQKERQAHNVKNYEKRIKQLESQAATKAEKNSILDRQLLDLEVAVAEKRDIYEATVAEDNTKLETEENYQMILQRKGMMDMAKMQAEDLLLLRTELERLRMKSFPALP